MAFAFKFATLLVALAGFVAIPAFAVTFESVALGAASNLTIFNMGATEFSASFAGTYFQGNAGVAAGGSTNFNGSGTLSGVLYNDPGANPYDTTGLTFGGVNTTTSLAQAVLDVNAASANAASLAPTQAIWAGNLINGHTFSSTGQFNVVQIAGTVLVSDPSKSVTLSGGANDWFIVNVLGGLKVSNGSIGLTGGLTANHVLINVLGGDMLGGNTVSLTNTTSSIYGTYLDVAGRIMLAPGVVHGAIMGNQIATSSGPTVYQNIYVPPGHVSPVPESDTYAMMLAGLGLIGVVAHRRRRLGNGATR